MHKIWTHFFFLSFRFLFFFCLCLSASPFYSLGETVFIPNWLLLMVEDQPLVLLLMDEFFIGQNLNMRNHLKGNREQTPRSTSPQISHAPPGHMEEE